MHKVVRIKNLDCANCAAELSEELSAIEGVESAFADFINQRVTLEYTSEEAFSKAVYHISHFEEVEIIENVPKSKKDRHLKEILSICAGAALFVPALVLQLSGMAYWVSFGLFLAATLAAGWEVLYRVAMNFPRMFRGGFHPSVLLDEALLMSVAAAGAFAIGENMEGAVVMILYQIGELLQNIAVGSSRGAIARLAALQSDTAIRLNGESQTEVPSEELAAGDVVLIRKGDRVPADCRILAGQTSLDTKSLTGEAYYREVGAGDELLAGCVNEGSAVRAEVLRPASQSAVAKILDLVENASAKKAKPEKFITKFARIYTPVVVLLAVLIAVFPPLWQGYNFSVWIPRALNFLVISCPCALIISVPLTYFSGVGTLARYGVLAKGAVGLDVLAKVKVAAFDKTGTLTEGKFSVANVIGGDHVLELAAAVEKFSSHPLAEAFTDTGAVKVESCEEIAGMGMSAVADGKRILVGNKRLMNEYGIAAEDTESENLTVYVARENELLGRIEIADRLRPEAAETLGSLKDAGIERVAVLTGDTRSRAECALAGLPVDTICAQLLPEEKPLRAADLKADGALMYVGDGVNDTPVMAESDVAFAMGGLGSDAAIEASDFVLASDRLSALPKAVRAAKKTRRIVLENIVGSIAVKAALLAFSLFGFIPPWAAIFGDVGVMLLAVLNSMRMRAKIK